jgi:hypothetical protein
MDEDVARQLLEELAKFGDVWNRLAELSMNIADEDDRIAFRHALGQLLGDCDCNLIRPIERRFPQLEGIAVKDYKS